MGLLIRQGKQNTEQDNKFNPVVDNDVMLEITNLKLADSSNTPNTLEVTFKILTGKYKGKQIFDRIQFAASEKFDMTWKYRSLRNCAGVPYNEKEGDTVDIEKLLLHKAVQADLTIRKGKNSSGEDTDYQGIKYKVAKVTSATATEKAVENVESTTFNDDVEMVEVVEPKPAKKTTPKPTVVAVEETTVEELNVDDEADWE